MRTRLFTERFEICLNKDQKKWLEKYAKARGLTMNEVLREFINHYLNQED